MCKIKCLFTDVDRIVFFSQKKVQKMKSDAIRWWNVYFRSMLPNLVLNNQKRLIKIGMK